MAETGTLRCWCNDYEAIAATSEEEAREVLRGMNLYDEQDLDGEGWSVLPDDLVLRDEDGKPTEETVGDAVRAMGKPGHLWSCEVG
jgi:hypothetical protein